VFLERLGALDAELMDAARARCGADLLQQIDAEAGEELAPFRERMAPPVFERSRRAAADRLIRERRRLPVIRFD
jgi:hypothetical protein